MSTQVQAPGWYDDPAGQARYRYWDGASWTHLTSNATSVSERGAGLGPGFARLGDWLARSLVLIALAAVALTATLIWAGTLLNPYGATLPSLAQPLDSSALAPALEADLTRAGIAVAIAFAAYGLVALVTGITWWVWQYRLAEAAPAALRRGAAMHLISWLIPIVNLWWPYQNMADLWRAYTPRTREDDVASGIGVWWAAYLGLPVVAWTLSFALTLSATPDNWLMRLAIGYALMVAAMAVAAVLARGVVHRLSWRALEYYATN